MYPTYRELESIVNLLNEAYTQSNEMEKLLKSDTKEKVLRGHIAEIRHRIWDAMQSVKDLGEQ